MFNRWKLHFLVWIYIKKKIDNKKLYKKLLLYLIQYLVLNIFSKLETYDDDFLFDEDSCCLYFWINQILKMIEPANSALTLAFCFCYTSSCTVKTCIFLVCFCYWPNSFMKGNEGGISSKFLDWKSLLFLLKIKIKQNPGCPNKEYNVVFKHFHQNIKAYSRSFKKSALTNDW